MLDAQLIRAAFRRLDEILVDRGIDDATALVVGGAAIALRFPQRAATFDVDAFFAPPEIRSAIEQVAEEFDLQPDWLNDGVKGFLPGDDPDAEALPGSALIVRIASPRYLLAMKLASARPEDAPDAALLANHLGIRSAQQALDVVTAYYPPTQLLPKVRYFAQELFGTGSDGVIEEEGERGPRPLRVTRPKVWRSTHRIHRDLPDRSRFR